METLENLIPRFKKVKTNLTEDWADQGITIPPTDAEVWGQMRAVAVQNREEALADDMQGFVETYDHRIAIINEMLKTPSVIVAQTLEQLILSDNTEDVYKANEAECKIFELMDKMTPTEKEEYRKRASIHI